ncbi:hypothetical protein amb2204 [Paramagnetospirillum magneticum AMB-1]|uniref:Uncharacterized protein n=1 Tax=Paramagnetospirillum magneticum (strain ATCC 700264 / AMB-1) TaxID=342108 RepID=Q2W567_PARM1|nr:hypothetical protein amb2204 [Paramagnetospirillum magneticum AMB-1]
MMVISCKESAMAISLLVRPSTNWARISPSRRDRRSKGGGAPVGLAPAGAMDWLLGSSKKVLDGRYFSPESTRRSALTMAVPLTVLGMKPAAPACTAETTWSRVEYPETITTGVSGMRVLICCNPERPSMPGIIRSSRTRPMPGVSSMTLMASPKVAASRISTPGSSS